MGKTVGVFFLLLMAGHFGRADISIRSKEWLESNGYEREPAQIVENKLSQKQNQQKSQPPPVPDNTQWPVKFESAQFSMGHVMAQYQNYGTGAYFHGGCDLRTEKDALVTAPVSGRLEAGHYSYAIEQDGTLIKYFKPWPEMGDPNYFEVAIVTKEGFRYELHHIDRNSLPLSLRRQLTSSLPQVKAGEPLGRVARWPVRGLGDRFYHHVHFNILSDQRVAFNPENHSPLIEDEVPPQLNHLFYRNSKGVVRLFGVNETLFDATEIIVGTKDFKDENIYPQMPAQISLAVDDQIVSSWDFREKLTASDGTPLLIRNVFVEELMTFDGQIFNTLGNYEDSNFLVRLPVPKQARGQLLIKVSDMAGNVSEVNAALGWPVLASSKILRIKN